MKRFGLTEAGASGINADSYYISENSKIFAISDGASGAFDKVGAGTICMNTVKEQDYACLDMQAKDYIIHSIKIANDRLIQKSQKDGHLSFTTMTLAVIDGDKLSIGAVGDTPAFLIKGQSISKIISPRKRYARLIELGILSKEAVDVAVHSLPNEMWSLFDNFLPMVIPQIAFEEYIINEGDILIICTDGVSDWINEEEFVSELQSSNSLEEYCNNLISKVKSRCPLDKLDDMTIVVAEL